MNIHRSLQQTSVRAALALLVLCWPLTGLSVPMSPFVLAGGAILAYDSVVAASMFGYLALMVVAELGYGIGVGVLSLSFMVTTIVAAAVRRWMSITPLSQESGWPLAGLGKGAVLSLALAVGMTIVSVLVSSWFYSAGMTSQRILFALGSPAMLVVALSIQFGILVVLRRIDTPFHRRITYGT